MNGFANHKLKVAFLFNDRDRYIGGPAVNARRLLTSLLTQGIDCTALVNCTGDAHPNADVLKANGVPVRIARRVEGTRSLVRWILKQLREIGPDVFIANTTLGGGLATPYLKKAGIPVVFAFRGDDQQNRTQVEFFTRPGSKFQSDALVCVSHRLAGLAKQCNPKQLISVIPSGVPVPAQMATPAVNKLSFIYSGRLVEQPKRILKLTEYFCRKATQNSPITLTILGEGDMKLKIKSIIRNAGLSQNIKVKAPLHDDKQYKCELSGHRFFVLFSVSEGMPGSLMDAMSCGLIPIVFHYPGADEIIRHGHNGFLFRNEQELDEVIKMAGQLSVREHRRFAFEARQTIVKNYSDSIMTDRWIDLLQNLKKSKSKRITLPRRISVPDEIKTGFYPEYAPEPVRPGNLKITVWLVPLRQKLVN